MPVTTELLSRLRSLDDLVEVAGALRYAARIEELPSAARRRLGLPDAVSRAAIVGTHAQLTLYGLHYAGSRADLAQAVESLNRHTRAAPFIVLALSAREPALTIACPCAAGGPPVRQLRIALDRPSPVAAEIISDLEPAPGESPRSLLARAADVLRQEGLTSRFFREMARLHQVAVTALHGMPRATREERGDLALVMLTRVLFLYFVQAKGWLAGRSDFLPSLLDTALRSGHRFHHAVYEPLCFGALSLPVGERRGTARALGAVPFLNGGLFERHALERRFPEAALPNETWRELLDDLFERFHFTLREHDDSDGVDPEMLGRVFEGLMARDRRRASGTYFTPRELLRDLVSDALDAALAGQPPRFAGRLRVLDPAVGSGAFLLEVLRQIEERLAGTEPGVSPAGRRRAIVRDCLFGVDLDPMAVRLAELRLWLALVVDDDATWETVAPLPNLDRNLRQGDSLLSPIDAARSAGRPLPRRLAAVAEQRAEYFAATGRQKRELALRLRSEERRLAREATTCEIRSLTARLEDVASQGRDLFGRRIHRRGKQQALVDGWRARRRDLQRVQRRIEDDDALPFFAFEVHFADVTARGFDIVIGNPPWVRGERLTAATRAGLSARYLTFRAASANGGFAHLPDLSVAFVERALELARPDGVIALILPAKLLRAGYAAPLRAHLRRRAAVLRLDDRSHAAASGFAATVFPLVCLLRNAPGAQGAVARVSTTWGERPLSGSTLVSELALVRDEPRSMWLPVPLRTMTALRSMLAAGRPLGSVFHPRLGVKTGANDVFLRDSAGELPGLQARALQGRDIGPFELKPSIWMLAALDERGAPLRQAPPQVSAWLAAHRRTLERRADASGAPLWAVFRTELLRHRWIVVWRDIAARLEAAVIDRSQPGAPIPLNTCYGVGVDDARTAHWLAAWLNSSLVRRAAELLAERASGGCFRFAAGTIAALPVPHAASPALGALARIGEAAVSRKAWDHDELDRIVAGALGLPAGFFAELSGTGNAVRRGTGGDRRPALPGAGLS